MIDKTIAMTYYKNKVKYLTLKDLYLGYKYKWYDVESSTVPIPYFSKDEISDHEYALTYKQWKAILTDYFKTVLDHLKEGNRYKMAHGLGTIQLVKYENRHIDFKAGQQAMKEGRLEKGQFLRKKDYDLDGYAFKLKWFKTKKYGVVFRNKYLFNLWIPNNVYKELHRWFKADKSRIYKLSDS
jgi:nucleoid DNA-binding protein